VYRPDRVYPIVRDRRHVAKSHKHKQCEDLCKKIAIMRAGGRCEICGEPSPEGHHIFYGSQYRNNLHLTFNPLFYAAACGGCHRIKRYAAHVDNEAFLIILQEKLLNGGQEARWRAIAAALKAPIDTDYVTLDLKEVYADLVVEYHELEAIRWMDTDIEAEFGRMG